MTARLLFVGLDAAEATLLERWAHEGNCPNLARVIAEGASFSLASSLETLPGAIWPEIVTGLGCGRQAHFYHGQQLHTGESEKRPIDAGEIDPTLYFWARASASGARVFVADMPQTVPTPHFNGLQLFEYGNHDRNFAIQSEPPELLADIRKHYGDHLVISCDAHGETPNGYHKLLEDLKVGAALKEKVFLDHLTREDWDLFAVCFSETHCVGHQYWHFQDPSHPKHDPRAPAAFKTAICDIYARVDAAIGALVEAAGPAAKIVLLASHGMALQSGGPNLLNEILARLGLTSKGQDTLSGRILRNLQFSTGPLAHALRETIKPLIGKRVIQAIQTESGGLHDPFSRRETQAAELRNNRCGAIRLNLKGREPFGEVAPGNEEAALIETIREALLELRLPDRKTPIVAAVRTAREAFGADHHPDVPDLMIVFRDDVGVLDACWSPRLGLIQRTVYQRWLPRTGDHTPSSRLWIQGGPFERGAHFGRGDVLDVGPTILGLMGLPVPHEIDGRNLAAPDSTGDIDPRVGPRAIRA